MVSRQPSIRDRARENRRPERAGEIAAARNQRQRRAAPAVEPAADIDIERRIDAAETDQADEQAVADIERPGRPQASTAPARWRSSRRRRSRSSACQPARRRGPSGCRRAGADPHQRAGKAGIERSPLTSAAMFFSATTVIHGAPNATAMTTSTTVATTQEVRVSTDDSTVDCSMDLALLARPAG